MDIIGPLRRRECGRADFTTDQGEIVKRIIGRWLTRLYRFALESRVNELAAEVERLQRENERLKSYDIVALERTIDLERGENTMLKEKLTAWRMQLKSDIELHAERIGES